MPQPVDLRQLNGWSPLPGAVLQRPDHAIRIAAIATEWTQVEHSITRLLAGAYGRTLFNDLGPYEVHHHPVAVAAMQAAETIRSRLKLLDLSVGVLVAGTSAEPEWQALRHGLQGRSRERNKVVHGAWGLGGTEPNELILQTSEGYSRWTVADLDAVLTRIIAVRGQVVSLTRAIMKAVHSGEIPQGEMGPRTDWLPGQDGSPSGERAISDATAQPLIRD